MLEMWAGDKQSGRKYRRVANPWDQEHSGPGIATRVNDGSIRRKRELCIEGAPTSIGTTSPRTEREKLGNPPTACHNPFLRETTVRAATHRGHSMGKYSQTTTDTGTKREARL